MGSITRHHGRQFAVPFWVDALGYLVERWPQVWIDLGNLESKILRTQLSDLEVRQPIYITGLARAGTTVLLELLAGHHDVVTHRYRDFPMLFTPWLWNRFVDRAETSRKEFRERPHGDGIVINAESPEAFEEVLWMAFFPELHNPVVDNRLTDATVNRGFEAFYRDHIRKLRLLRNGRRYLTKANYNLTRLRYLLKLFPDARFVVPIRDPQWHVASLMKQHRRFLAVGTESPRVRRRMRRSGHFEFGCDRRPINPGDEEAVTQAVRLWEAGEEIAGWCVYWSSIYGHLARSLAAEPALRQATLVVRFEDLCEHPGAVLAAILHHCRLSDDGLTSAALKRIQRPHEPRSPFTAAEAHQIRQATRKVARCFGYDEASATTPIAS